MCFFLFIVQEREDIESAVSSPFPLSSPQLQLQPVGGHHLVLVVRRNERLFTNTDDESARLHTKNERTRYVQCSLYIVHVIVRHRGQGIYSI